MYIPKTIDLNINAEYCISCFSQNPRRTHINTLPYYECRVCGATTGRRLVLDNNIEWWIDRKNAYWHESAGVILVNDEKRILCMLRRVFPFAYSIPSGHVDKSEAPLHAAARELKEETGIEIEDPPESIGTFEMAADSCARGSDNHLWHLYRCRTRGDVKVRLSDEASEMLWLSYDELLNLNPITYPLKVIIEKFGSSLTGIL